jgi:hypothetical protein
MQRPNDSYAGHVRIFEWNNEAWNKLGDDIDGEAVDDWSSISVALSSHGSTVAVGARYNDGNGPYAGYVQILEWNNEAWNQPGDDIVGETAGDNSGGSLALSSDEMIVAIGAKNNNGNGSNSGHVIVLEWDDTETAWNELGGDTPNPNGQCDMILTKDNTFANGLGLELQIRI